MCLSSSSFDYIVNGAIPHADLVIAKQIFTKLWPKLDHTRRYCLNPTIVAAELLEYANVGRYPQVRRFKGCKGQYYKDTLSILFSHVELLSKL
jgi:hypothetical protein